MKRVMTVAAIVAVMVSGCGNASNRGAVDTRSPAGTPAEAPATSVTTDGVYEVGVDIAPGVYTTRGIDCIGYTASNPDLDLEDSSSAALALENDGMTDAYLAGSIRVGEVQRMVVHEGEFFTSAECDHKWRRENTGEPQSPDPATLAGGCEILVGGDDLVQAVVSFLRKPTSAQDTSVGSELQDGLMAPVEAHNRQLGDPAGQLVDSLDDPPAYVNANGEPDSLVARALAKIANACGRS